jgi:hypothetical protein
MTRKRTQTVIKRSLLSDVRRMIEETRSAVAVTVNAGLTILYWRIGTRIRKDILADQRAEYGKQSLVTLSRGLLPAFGRGFGEKNLRRMVQFAEAFPDQEIVAALLRQLGWTHFTMTEGEGGPQIAQMTQIKTYKRDRMKLYEEIAIQRVRSICEICVICG